MDFYAALDTDSRRAIADMIVKAIDNNPVNFKEVINICFRTKYPIAMRAARVIQLCCEENPGLILPHLNQAVENVVVSKIDGVKRSFLKIFIEYVDINEIKQIGLLVNACFDWLVDQKQPTAVRMFCMVFLLKFCKIEPDLKNELIDIIETQKEHGTVGFKNAANKTLLKLRKGKF